MEVVTNKPDLNTLSIPEMIVWSKKYRRYYENRYHQNFIKGSKTYNMDKHRRCLKQNVYTYVKLYAKRNGVTLDEAWDLYLFNPMAFVDIDKL